MSLLICIPACHKDIGLALDNLRKCIELDGRSKHHAAICVDPQVPKDTGEELVKLAREAFQVVNIIGYCAWKGSQEWPRPQNHAWQSVCREISYNDDRFGKYSAWLWWEADASYLKAGGWDILWKEYQRAKRPFLGHITEHGHMNGVAIYPRELYKYSTDAYICQDAFDVVLSRSLRIGRVDCRVTKANNLILHTFKSEGGSLPAPIGENAKHYPDAVLFHGATYSHIKTEQSSGPAPQLSFMEQTKWPSGMFLLPSNSNIVYFNPTLLWHFHKWHLFVRRCIRTNVKTKDGGNYQASDLCIFKFDDFGKLPLEMTVVKGPNRYPLEQWEDPRAIIKNGRVLVGMATWVQRQPWKIRQALVKLSKEWDSFKVSHEPIYGGNHDTPQAASDHEKNWVWFDHQTQDLLFVYKTNPLEIVKPGGQVWRDHMRNTKWEHGEMRGGTAPVRVGDEYISFFHSSGPWISPRRRYYMGAFAFKAEPPFWMTRCTPKPLLCGSENDPRFFNGPPCIFPGGAVLRDDVWSVVFGVNDENCGWMRIPHADLNERMMPV